MNADQSDYKCKDLTEKIIGIFYEVYNELGYGFLEKVYENAVMIELRQADISAKAQMPISVMYGNETIGEYTADILVENKVIVEIKAVKALMAEHEAQLLNYLKATEIEVGLLINFGPKPEIRRRVFDNKRKYLR